MKQNNITIFTRTTCAPCRMLKSWLQHKGLNYREINVDENPEAQAEAFKLSGYSIVPLTIVTQPDGYRSIIAGYNLSALAAIV